MDPVQAINLVVAGFKAAGAVGRFMEQREKRKTMEARASTQTAGSRAPGAPGGPSSQQIEADADTARRNILLVLGVLGEKLITLGVVNDAWLPFAKEEAVKTLGMKAHSFKIIFEEEMEEPMQNAVTAALFLCAGCWPMHIYRGFGACVLNEWLWSTPDPAYHTYNVNETNQMDDCIALLKTATHLRDVIRAYPKGLSQMTGRYTKEDTEGVWYLDHRNGQIKKRGFPQPIDRNFKVTEIIWPFSKYDSPFAVKNQFSNDFGDIGNVIEWQQDPGRMIYAFVVGGFLDLEPGQMIEPTNEIASSILWWLFGLNGTTFKLIYQGNLDISLWNLKAKYQKRWNDNANKQIFAIRDETRVAAKKAAMLATMPTASTVGLTMKAAPVSTQPSGPVPQSQPNPPQPVSHPTPATATPAPNAQPAPTPAPAAPAAATAASHMPFSPDSITGHPPTQATPNNGWNAQASVQQTQAYASSSTVPANPAMGSYAANSAAHLYNQPPYTTPVNQGYVTAQPAPVAAPHICTTPVSAMPPGYHSNLSRSTTAGPSGDWSTHQWAASSVGMAQESHSMHRAMTMPATPSTVSTEYSQHHAGAYQAPNQAYGSQFLPTPSQTPAPVAAPVPTSYAQNVPQVLSNPAAVLPPSPSHVYDNMSAQASSTSPPPNDRVTGLTQLLGSLNVGSTAQPQHYQAGDQQAWGQQPHYAQTVQQSPVQTQPTHQDYATQYNSYQQTGQQQAASTTYPAYPTQDQTHAYQQPAVTTYSTPTTQSHTQAHQQQASPTYPVYPTQDQSQIHQQPATTTYPAQTAQDHTQAHQQQASAIYPTYPTQDQSQTHQPPATITYPAQTTQDHTQAHQQQASPTYPAYPTHDQSQTYQQPATTTYPAQTTQNHSEAYQQQAYQYAQPTTQASYDPTQNQVSSSQPYQHSASSQLPQAQQTSPAPAESWSRAPTAVGWSEPQQQQPRDTAKSTSYSFRKVEAQFDFTARTGSEFSFKKGEVLDILEDSNGDGWLLAWNGVAEGRIPEAYVKAL